MSNFLEVPFEVTKNKYLFFSSVISKIEEISSFLSNDNKFIIGCHFEVLFDSGIS
jgi:hypothetical protein